MNEHMERSMRAWLLLIVLVLVAFLAALWATSVPWFEYSIFRPRLRPPDNPYDIEFFYTAKTVVSTINITLLAFLLATYVEMYWKTRSEFTIGLMIFSGVLLLNALASNPFVILAFGFSPFGLGPFAFLPDLFTFGALIVLLYLSVRY